MKNKKILKKFEEIYDETYNNTFKYIICKYNNFEDVNDIIQETYVELYRVLKQGKEIENNQAYIIAIAKNRIIKYLKLKEKIETISLSQEDDNEEFTIDLDSRHKFRKRIYYKK